MSTTTAAQHTPGPWKYRETTSNYKAGFHVEGTGGAALVYGASEANARLISAAPEMLAALEEVAQALRIDLNSHLPIGSCGVVEAAIRKAKGGQ